MLLKSYYLVRSIVQFHEVMLHPYPYLANTPAIACFAHSTTWCDRQHTIGDRLPSNLGQLVQKLGVPNSVKSALFHKRPFQNLNRRCFQCFDKRLIVRILHFS